MSKKLLIPLIIALFCTQTALYAQTKAPKTSKKENEAPKKEVKKGNSKDVQVFDNKDDYEYFEKKANTNSKNIIKFNPFDIFLASFPIYYERVLAPKISAEIGLGVTTTTGAFTALEEVIFNNVQTEGFYKGKTGLMFKLGMRYYPSKHDDTPEGTYLGLEYQVRQYAFDAYPYKNGARASQGPYQNTTITQQDLIRFILGYQMEGRGSFNWDPYIGIGWRKLTFNGWYENDSNVPVLGQIAILKPTFIIGCKVGLGF